MCLLKAKYVVLVHTICTTGWCGASTEFLRKYPKFKILYVGYMTYDTIIHMTQFSKVQPFFNLRQMGIEKGKVGLGEIQKAL